MTCATIPSGTRQSPSSGGSLGVTLSVRDMPEVVSELRKRIATIVREFAEHETPLVKERLRQAADLFEEE